MFEGHKTQSWGMIFLLVAVITLSTHFLYNLTFEQAFSYLQSLTHKNISEILSPQHFIFLKYAAFAGVCLFAIGMTLMIVFLERVSRHFLQIKVDGALLYQSTCSFVKRTWAQMSSFEKWFLITIIAIGCFFYTRSALSPLRNDEATVLFYFADKPFWIIPTLYQNVGNHIFHTLLMHISVELFGDSQLAIRLPVLFAGCLTLPIAFFVLTAFGKHFKALATVSLMATSSALTLFAGNSRGYMIQVLLTFILLGSMHILRTRENRAAWSIFIGSSVLSFWTVPTTIFAYGGMWLWFAYSRYKENLSFKTLFLKSALAGFITLLLYSPALIVLKGIGHMNTMLGHAGSGISFEFIRELIKDWSPENTYMSVFMFLMATAGLIKQLRRIDYFCLFLLLFFAVTTQFVFMGFVRLYLVFAPFYYLLIAEALESIVFKQIRWILLFILMGTSVYEEGFLRRSLNNPFDGFKSTEKIAQDIGQFLLPGDRLTATCPANFPLFYQIRRQGFKVLKKDLFYKGNKIWTFEIIGDTPSKPKRLWSVRMKDRFCDAPRGKLMLDYSDATVELIELP